MGNCTVSEAPHPPPPPPPGPSPSPMSERRRAAIAGHTGDIDAARSLLDHPEPKVRATSLGALNRAGGLEPDDLRRALTDPDSSVRRRACEELARWNTDTTLPTELADSLTDLLFDDEDTVVEVAAWAWGERPPATARAFERLLAVATGHDDALCRESAVAALGALGDERAVPAILQATTDRATVRRRAIIALAPFDGPEVDAALERAKTDRDWQVRQAAEDLTL